MDLNRLTRTLERAYVVSNHQLAVEMVEMAEMNELLRQALNNHLPPSRELIRIVAMSLEPLALANSSRFNASTASLRSLVRPADFDFDVPLHPASFSSITNVFNDEWHSSTVAAVNISTYLSLMTTMVDIPVETHGWRSIGGNFALMDERLSAPQKEVEVKLKSFSANWAINDNKESLTTFEEYFLIKMWGTSEARNNTAAFAEKQLSLLEQMDNDPELWEACLALAVAGMADCHDNAFAMFLEMQEKALEITMNKPGVSLEDLINYGLTLENKAKLAQLIENTPELSRSVNKSEGIEVQLALRLLCHEKNIVLPVPVTSMSYEAFAWMHCMDSDTEPLFPSNYLEIKERVSHLVESQIPLKDKPDAEFLAAQPYWQAYINQQNPTLGEKIDAINEYANKLNELLTDVLFDSDVTTGYEIGEKLKAIEMERKDNIAKLYVEATAKILENQV